MDGTGRLSDQAITTDCLNSEKFAASTAGQWALESASPFVKRDFESIGRDCSQNVEVIFRVMNSKGWYTVQPASQQSATQSQQQASSTLNGITGTVTPAMTMGVGQAGRFGAQPATGYGAGGAYGMQAGAYGGPTGAGYAPGGGTAGYTTQYVGVGGPGTPMGGGTAGGEVIVGRGPSSAVPAGGSRRRPTS